MCGRKRLNCFQPSEPKCKRLNTIFKLIYKVLRLNLEQKGEMSNPM